MKKMFLFLSLMIGTLTAHADDYTYLTFETTDGAKISVSVSSLTISISGSTLTAGEQSFTLSNLSKMYFSTSDETNATRIEAVTADWKQVSEIYDLNGRKVTIDQAEKGVYIVKSKNGTFKLIAK